MHTVDLIAEALSQEQKCKLPETPKENICCVTGDYVQTISKKHLFGSSFCDHQLLKVPTSDYVGINAWYAFKYGYLSDPQKKKLKTPETQSCWFADGKTFKEFKKIEIRKLFLFGSPNTPWACWVTTSYKKHGALRAPINYNLHGRIGFDDLIVNGNDLKKKIHIWEKLREAQMLGISKNTMSTLDISIYELQKIGVGKCKTFLSWANSWYHSPLYLLLCYLLPSKEEIQEGYIDEHI